MLSSGLVVCGSTCVIFVAPADPALLLQGACPADVTCAAATVTSGWRADGHKPVV